MPNSLTGSGLVVATAAELVANFNLAFTTIYGTGVNLDPETPDGQMINIFVQAVIDLEELLVNIYNSFDPDNAVGTVLDQRVAINGIQRQAGTFSTTNITLVLTQSLNLYGQDQTAQVIYTVSDNAGNQWQLTTTNVGLAPGTHTLPFQSVKPGALTTTPNTITVPVTVVLGVNSINNPNVQTYIGVNEESDANLKIRRQKAVAQPSSGFYAGLYSALSNIPGISFVRIVENDTNGTGVTGAPGLPGHSMWVILGGDNAGSNAAVIGSTIYTYRSAGCGLYDINDGTQEEYTIVQADGTFFPVYWSGVNDISLYTRFTVTSLDGINIPNYQGIYAQLSSLLTPSAGGQVNINDLATVIQQDIDSNTLVTNAGFYTAATPAGSFVAVLSPGVINQQFVLGSNTIIITPMLLTPGTSQVPHGNTEQFTSQGGYSTRTYSISVNNSGGSINALTGSYTAGSTAGVTDTILVTDSDFVPNTATATVQVT